MVGVTAAVKKRIHDATDKVALQKRALVAATRDAACYHDWLLAATKLKVTNRSLLLLQMFEGQLLSQYFDRHPTAIGSFGNLKPQPGH